MHRQPVDWHLKIHSRPYRRVDDDLKRHLHRELKDPRIARRQAARPADITLDFSERAAVQGSDRRAEVRMVRKVERLDSELQVLLFPNLEAPRQTHIDPDTSWALNAERRHIAIRSKRWYRECRGVQPAAERLVCCIGGRQYLVGQLTALSGQSTIGSRGDAQRLPASKHDDI